MTPSEKGDFASMDLQEDSSRFGVLPVTTLRNMSSSSSTFFSANQSPFFSPRSPTCQISESTRSDFQCDSIHLSGDPLSSTSGNPEPASLANVRDALSDMSRDPVAEIGTDFQKFDRILSSTGISNSSPYSYSYVHDNGYSGFREKHRKHGRSHGTSYTPVSVSLSCNRLRSCDVFIGLHGRKPSLLRFANWLRAELEVQGMSCFVSDRARCRNSRKHEIVEKAMDLSSFGIVILTKKSFRNPYTIEELRYFASKKNLVPVFFDLTPDDCLVRDIVEKRGELWEKHGGELWLLYGGLEKEWKEAVNGLSRVDEWKLEAQDGNWRDCILRAVTLLAMKLGRRSVVEGLTKWREKVDKDEFPFPRNENFIGRKKELSELEFILFGDVSGDSERDYFELKARPRRKNLTVGWSKSSSLEEKRKEKQRENGAKKGKEPVVWKESEKEIEMQSTEFSQRQRQVRPKSSGRYAKRKRSTKIVYGKGIACVSGESGIGKTELLLEFAYRYHQRYKMVLWIAGESRYIRQNYLNLWSFLEVDVGVDNCLEKGRIRSFEEQEGEAISRVRKELMRNIPFLVVIDNLDSEKDWWDQKLIMDLLPRFGGETHIIISTRLPRVMNLEPLKLSYLSGLEAMCLMQGNGKDYSITEIDALRVIEEKVGRLTLGLAVAGAILCELPINPSRLLDTINRMPMREISWSGREAHLLRRNTFLFQLFEVCFSIFDHADGPRSLASRMVQASGWFAPTAIPVSLLALAANKIPQKHRGTHLWRKLLHSLSCGFTSYIRRSEAEASSMLLRFNIARSSTKQGYIHAVEALAAIFKVGSRKVLIDVVPIVWNDTSSLVKSGSAARSPLLRKYLVKLTQRIGLTCLPHRSPAWCYVGRTSSLGQSISLSASKRADQWSHDVDINFTRPEETANNLQDEDMDVPEIVEEIIEILLSGLRDTDTVVRWSAAKGMGRITSRLTSVLSEEVLSSVLELFSPGEGDGSWHGACLALAELARRGLLLPISLPKVVPFVVKALHYDIRRGPHSVGSHVRDAAAYVCWAFGRAYYHTDMREVLEQVAPHLLTVACYDREVNCRRAAAAAFQENVGRQGTYPHGIDIVNTADYFSLSSRVNSYLHVAVSIVQYEGYLYPFAEELLYNKIGHWDKGLRELAAEALSALVKYDPEYFARFVLEKLIPCTLSSDLCMRHGATLAVGEVVLALHQSDYALETGKQKDTAGIVPAIEKARLYRGKGGEIMRSAVSRFIECISLCHLTLPEKIKRSLLDTLYDNLKHPNSQIQDAAVKALKHFVQVYLVSAKSGGAGVITSKYLEQLTDKNVAVRRGSALALGVLPFESLAGRGKDVILKLCSSCAIEDNPEDRDAEARVNAVKGLISVCKTLTQARECSDICPGEDRVSLCHLIKNEVIPSLFKALDDYSVDNRGDVGSWVREAAMEGLETCTYILCLMDSTRKSNGVEPVLDLAEGTENNQMLSFFDANLAAHVIEGIVKQAVEKMDKIRESAAKVLQRILYNRTIFVPFIPHRESLEEIIPNEADLKWGVPTFLYPRFIKLLKFSCYSKAMLSGLVISIGGLQDSLRKVSISALLDYLQGVETEDPNDRRSREHMLSADILWVLQQYKKCDRVIVPTLKTIEILFSKTIFLNMEVHTPIFCAGVLDSVAVELKGSKDFSKLYAGIAILGYIASLLEPVNTRAFSQLLTFLCHRYPKIRKASAEQVYLVLLQNGNLVPEHKLEKALEIISDTCWDGDIETAKHQRLELYKIAGLDLGPVRSRDVVSSKDSEKRSMANDENASYSSLVGSTGF